MKRSQIKVNTGDLKKISALKQIRTDNFDVLDMYSWLLTGNSRIITKDLLKSAGGYDEGSYIALLCAIFSLKDSERDKRIMRKYLVPSVCKLDNKQYRQNKYYANISIPQSKLSNWEFKQEFYAPYEAFIFDQHLQTADFREIPKLGFFAEKFSFPSVLEKGNEWMSIMPNELNTLAQPISNCHGKVVTLGLGLGYFAYMAALKDNVSSVTVIERDESVIKLFNDFLLPQFSCKEKIKVVCDDAYTYLQDKMKVGQYDYLLADIWRNSFDGAEHYLKIAKYEQDFPTTTFDYWVESEIISRLRWQLFDEIAESTQNSQNLSSSAPLIEEYLSAKYLHNLAKEGTDIF